jgi:hypothetical protein
MIKNQWFVFCLMRNHNATHLFRVRYRSRWQNTTRLGRHRCDRCQRIAVWQGRHLEPALYPGFARGMLRRCHPRRASIHDFGFTGSLRTMSKVQIGPKNREANHQSNPLRPLLWASPALISESVNHPTAYSPAFCEMVICF